MYKNLQIICLRLSSSKDINYLPPPLGGQHFKQANPTSSLLYIQPSGGTSVQAFLLHTNIPSFTVYSHRISTALPHLCLRRRTGSRPRSLLLQRAHRTQW